MTTKRINRGLRLNIKSFEKEGARKERKRIIHKIKLYFKGYDNIDKVIKLIEEME